MMVKKKLARIKRWSTFTKVFSKIALPVVIQRIQEVIRGKDVFAKNSFNMTTQVVDLRGMRREQKRTIQVDQGECISFLDPVFFTEILRKCHSASFKNDDGSCAHVHSPIREFVSDQFISLLRR
jgi:hypothetical protein